MRAMVILASLFLVMTTGVVNTSSIPSSSGEPTTTSRGCFCSDQYAPVCGQIDKKLITYDNECKFNCVHYSGKTIVHRGICLEYDCLQKCPVTFPEHICGSNNVTYDSLCALNCYKKYNKYLENVTEMPDSWQGCSRRTDCVCNGKWEPVCASDGVTYLNQCEYGCRNRNLHSTLMANATCNEYYFTVCDNECPVNIQGVCASNRRTYKSDCSVDCYSIFVDRRILRTQRNYYVDCKGEKLRIE